jgi:hypothetical protein
MGPRQIAPIVAAPRTATTRVVHPLALPALLVLPAAVLGLTATGCVHEPDADLDTALTQPAPEPEPVVRRDVTMPWARAGEPSSPAPVLAASPRDRPPPDPIPFRIGAGHGALGTIDLAPCRAEGLPSGYLAMRVTFHRDGRVAHAVVEGPVAPPQEALDCVAEQIEEATVPVFDGRDASLTKRFFVEQGDNSGLEPGDTVVQKGGKPARRKALDAAGLTRR